MTRDQDNSFDRWSEENSQTFLDYGRYFVPAREQQIETICDLIPDPQIPFNIMELCCGEGLLASAFLKRFPLCAVYGYDGSATMLQQAQTGLTSYGERFQPVQFDLAATSWRHPSIPVQAVVSSLAIHHLDGEGKRILFQDIYQFLSTGGALIVADIVAPASRLGTKMAAKAWDAAVRQRSLELDGSMQAFEYFEKEKWNSFRYVEPDDIDKPSTILDQLHWLEQAGFACVDVHWMQAGHAIFGGEKRDGHR